jgi:glycosyltransferase involved in cell wall biosynthesis
MRQGFGRTQRERMPELLSGRHILLLPWIQEPIARLVLEPMASRLPVVSLRAVAPEGLSKRELPDDVFGWRGLPRQIERLAVDPELRQRLASQGRPPLLERLSPEHVVNQIKQSLAEACASQAVHP